MVLLRPVIAAVLGCGIAAGLIVTTAPAPSTTTIPVDTVVPSPSSTDALPIDASSTSMSTVPTTSISTTVVDDEVDCDEAWEALAVAVPSAQADSRRILLERRLTSVKVRIVASRDAVCLGQVKSDDDASPTPSNEIGAGDTLVWLYVLLPSGNDSGSPDEAEQEVEEFARLLGAQIDRWSYEVAEPARTDDPDEDGDN